MIASRHESGENRLSQIVFVLEDDTDISRLVQHHLEAAGFTVRVYGTPTNIVADAERQSPALFLLDELLHGTNSHDRALGSLGLIRALLAKGGIGLVTTHDLSLTKLADDLSPAASNVHFEDRLVAGELVFDYRMHPGVVTRSNALDLMRAVGLDV